MNIVLDKYSFNKNNLFFTETRKNIILDGNFTKIIYSDFSFTMNSVYIIYPIFRYYVDKNILYFQLNEINTENVDWFSSIEQYILDTYCKENAITKNKVFSLQNQVLTGKIRIYKDNCSGLNNGNMTSSSSSHTLNSMNLDHTNYIILKISGVWENVNNVGVTYKFIYPI